MTVSPDRTTLASGHGTTIRLWDVTTGNNTAVLQDHTGHTNSLAFSPEGTILVSGSSDGTVRLWDVTKQGIIATLETHGDRNAVHSVAFSPDGTTIASGHYNRTASLWNVATGARTATLEGHTYVPSVVFSPDGAILATVDTQLFPGPQDPKIRLWDVATGTRTATFELDTDWILSLSFSSEMTPIALGGIRDGTAELWDVATTTRIATISAHPAGEWILNGAFSPDESMYVFGAIDNGRTVQLWDFAAETITATLYGHKDRVDVVRFSPDGRFFATGSRDGTVLLWDMQLVIPHPQNLTKLSGDNQQELPGSTLAQAFEVSVLDQNGDPFAGATVTFAVTAGGGTLSATTATTDENGRAAATLTLGSDPGRNTVAVRVADLKPVIFSATAQAVPTKLRKVSGDEQEGPVGAALSDPLVVEIQDQVGNPFEGTQIIFAVTTGGGTLSTTTDTTDANGRAATTLTLGSRPGTNTVSVWVARLESVFFTATGQASPQTLTKISGDGQKGTPGVSLSEPFVVSVLDQTGAAFAGATVTFAVTVGDATLSTTTATTDENGRASSTLTLGSLPGSVTVTVSVAGLGPVTFAATASPDFDGDGETGFSDFFLFADAFGGSDPRFDLDGSGTVDFADFFLLADYFADPARGKLLALAQERIGLPDGPQLQQNAPNPFNSETVISWFLLRPGPAGVEVFALTGQRVAVLHQGPKKAGVHQVHWNGRDDQGRPLASGVYLYRLVTAESVQTRKLTLLR